MDKDKKKGVEKEDKDRPEKGLKFIDLLKASYVGKTGKKDKRKNDKK